MADNTTFTPGTGGSASTDQLAGGEHVPHVKVMDGTSDSEIVLKVVAEDAAHSSGDTGIVVMAVRKDTAASLAGADGDYIPLIVDSTGRLHIANADLATLAGAVAGTEFQCDIITSVLPTGAATSANQTTVIGHIDGIEVLLTTIDSDTSALAGTVAGSEQQVDVVESALPAGASTSANQTTIIGHVDGIETLLGTIDADTSTLAGTVAGSEQQVDVVTMPGTAAEDAALPAVAVVIAADDGTDTHLLQVDANGYLKAILQTGSDAIGKLSANSGVDIGDVDVASSSGQAAEGAALPGVFFVVAGDDGTDTHPLQVDANGYLKAVLQTSADVDIGAVDVTTLPAANLSQRAMAASLSVVPANNVPDATYIGDIKFGEELQAGENVVGLVGASDKMAEVSPDLDEGNAHTAGDVLFDAQELASVGRVSGGIVMLKTVLVIDRAEQVAAGGLTLFFFDRTVTFGTANAGPSISDADAAYYMGELEIASSEFSDLGGVAVATVDGGLIEMQPNATSLFVAATCTGTPTPVADGEVTIKCGFIRS